MWCEIRYERLCDSILFGKILLKSIPSWFFNLQIRFYLDSSSDAIHRQQQLGYYFVSQRISHSVERLLKYKQLTGDLRVVVNNKPEPWSLWRWTRVDPNKNKGHHPCPKCPLDHCLAKLKLWTFLDRWLSKKKTIFFNINFY